MVDWKKLDARAKAKKLRAGTRAAYTALYFIYAFFVGVFALLVAIETLVPQVDVLGSVSPSPEAIALLGLALVAPLAPLAERIEFGSASATLRPMTPDAADEIEGRIGRGIATAMAELGGRGLPDLTGGDATESTSHG